MNKSGLYFIIGIIIFISISLPVSEHFEAANAKKREEAIRVRENNIRSQIESTVSNMRTMVNYVINAEALRTNALAHVDYSFMSNSNIALPALIIFDSPYREKTLLKSFIKKDGPLSLYNRDFHYGISIKTNQYNIDFELESPLIVSDWHYVDTEGYSNHMGMAGLSSRDVNWYWDLKSNNLFSMPRLLDFTLLKSIIVIKGVSRQVGSYTDGSGAFSLSMGACVLSYPDLKLIAGATFTDHPPSVKNVTYVSQHSPITHGAMPMGSYDDVESQRLSADTLLTKWLCSNSQLTNEHSWSYIHWRKDDHIIFK